MLYKNVMSPWRIEVVKTYTAGTRQLTVQVDVDLRQRLDERVAAEDRTLRSVVERALAYYMANVPLEAQPVEAKPVKKPAKKK